MLRRLAVLFVAAAAIGGASMASTTAQVCIGHYVTDPYVATVNNGVVTLNGAGGIGCGNTSKTSTVKVTITVQMQSSQDGVTWTDEGQAFTQTAQWTRFWRYSRTAGGTVTATCHSGMWRTHVTSSDGTWDSGVTVFAASDGGENPCGEIGGA